MPEFTLAQLKQGMVIVYLLRHNQLPTHPEREWRGKIKKLFSSAGAVEVEILNEGFEGDTEPVFLAQIIKIESEAHPDS